MKTSLLALAFLLSLVLPSGAAPLTYEEISLLVRMKESDSFVIQQLMQRRLLRALTPQQESALKAQGAAESLLSAFRSPNLFLTDAEALAYDERREKKRLAQSAEEAAFAAAPPAGALSKEDFQIVITQNGQGVNLSQWGGPSYEVQIHFQKRTIGPDVVLAVLKDLTRTFVDSATVTAGGAGGAGFATHTHSHSPVNFIPISRNPVLVRGLPTLYLVYEAGGVSVYYAGVAAEAADSVKLAIKVAKKPQLP